MPGVGRRALARFFGPVVAWPLPARFDRGRPREIAIDDAALWQQLLGSAKARVEHIAVEVTGLPAVFERLTALGVKFRRSAPRRIRDTLNAWTIADTTDGISCQLTQHLNARSIEGERFDVLIRRDSGVAMGCPGHMTPWAKSARQRR